MPATEDGHGEVNAQRGGTDNTLNTQTEEYLSAFRRKSSAQHRGVIRIYCENKAFVSRFSVMIQCMHINTQEK